jgi:hypothetical protein
VRNSTKNAQAQPRSRDDLSFTARDAEGRLDNWRVVHSQNDNWGQTVPRGKGYFSEVAALAQFSEQDAFHAIYCAVNDRGWDNRGWGEEYGFSRELAAAAIVGLRALRAGAKRFNPDAPASEEQKIRRKQINRVVRERDRQLLASARRDAALQQLLQQIRPSGRRHG